mmetsp:Transcript_67798/g.192159  ORF Transcript_67798/g.192159 Transcript_67798/m.192159 type:complete len:358 (-) Transcript_67798:449-1522(-)
MKSWPHEAQQMSRSSAAPSRRTRARLTSGAGSFSFFTAAAFRAARSLVPFAASLSCWSVRRQTASLLNSDLKSLFSVVMASSPVPISPLLAVSDFDNASSTSRVASTILSALWAASCIASGDASSATSATGLAASEVSATLASAALTSSAASLARRSTLAFSSLRLASSSIFRRSSARRFSVIWSTRSWAWSMARSASCSTFSACEPIFSSCSVCVVSSSVRSSSKLSGVAIRTRWMTLRTTRAAACSCLRASSSSRFFFSSSCRRCISSSFSCCRFRISSCCRLRSASLWAISASWRWRCSSVMPPSPLPPAGGQACGGIILGAALGSSFSVSSTGPSQGTFQPLVGGSVEALLTL